VNLYGASTLDTAWTDGSHIKLRQDTNYPWEGAIKLTMSEVPDHAVKLKLRIPGWMHTGASKLKINGKPVDADLKPGTYAEVKRTWKPGDVVELTLDFQPVMLESNPLVEETFNQVTVKYGPLVYCLESNDLPKGVKLSDVVLSADPKKLKATPDRKRS